MGEISSAADLGRMQEHEQTIVSILYWRLYDVLQAMVTDDIYAIVGSANINQRSMDGRRDTEVAVGCWEADKEDVLVNDGHVQALRKVSEFSGIYIIYAFYYCVIMSCRFVHHCVLLNSANYPNERVLI